MRIVRLMCGVLVIGMICGQVAWGAPPPPETLAENDGLRLEGQMRNLGFGEEMTGVWRLVRPDGTTLIGDLLPILKPLMPDSRRIEYVQPFSIDVRGNGTRSVVLLIQLDWQSENGRDWPSGCSLVIFGDDLKPLHTLELPGSPGKLHIGSLRKGQPPIIGDQHNCAGSAQACPWVFFQWRDGAMRQVLETDIASWSSPQFTDLDHDGTNEILFENGGTRLDQVFTWDDQKHVLVEAAGRYKSRWQAQIDVLMKKLRSERLADRYGVIWRAAQLYRLRGGDKGVDEFLRLAERHLAPLIKNDRNDYDQQRAKDLMQRTRAAVGRPSSEGGAPK
ncbi:MAG: hypothetical protein AAB152_16210 [Candidatus Coatesbacteria bacterium]